MSTARRGAAQPKFLPVLETLESRLVPAITVLVTDLDTDGADDIVITGDTLNTTINILDNDVASTITVQVDKKSDGFGGPGDPLDTVVAVLGESSVIVVSMSDGNDTVNYQIVGVLTGDERSVFTSLGNGNDAFSLTDSDGAFSASAASVAFFEVNAGSGKDDVDFEFGEINNSAVNVVVNLGSGRDGVAGSDPCRLACTDVDNTASLQADYELGTGSNAVEFELSGLAGASSCAVDIDVLGGNEATAVDDVSVIINDAGIGGGGATSTMVNIDAVLQGGNDVFAVDFVATAINTIAKSNVHIGAQGGAGNDSLTVGVSGSLYTIAADAILDVDLEGGAGNDTIQFSTITDGLIVNGLLRVHQFGGIGNDSLTFGADFADTSTGVYDLTMAAGDGADTVTLAVGNDAGAVPNHAGALFDGGRGFDDVNLTFVDFTFILFNFEA